MIEWPMPPVPDRRDFHTRGSGQPLATPSAGVYSTNAVQDYTSDGLSVMQLLLTKWHKSIAANQRYYRSFTVYGQVKLKEARNATAFLGPGPNNTTTCTAWEILSELFSSFPAPAGPAALSLLSHLVWPLFSNVDVILTNLASEVHRKDREHFLTSGDRGHRQTKEENAPSSNERMSSSFDAGAVTHQEMHTRFMVKIGKLKVESHAMDGQRLSGSKEHAKRRLILNGEVTIWQKSIKGFVFIAWRKWSVTNKLAVKRLAKVLFSDRHGVGANNKQFTLKLVFSMWRSIFSSGSAKRMVPEMSQVEDRSVALEQLVTKDERKVTQLKGKVRGYNKDVEKILSAIKAKERQLAMLIAQLERLRASTEPKRMTMELFSKYARLCWNQHADTIMVIMQLAHTDLQAAPADWAKKRRGMGLGIISRGRERTIFTAGKAFAGFGAAAAMLGPGANAPDPIAKSPIYEWVTKQWAMTEEGGEGEKEAEREGEELKTQHEGREQEQEIQQAITTSELLDDDNAADAATASATEDDVGEEDSDNDTTTPSAKPTLRNTILKTKMKSITAFFGVRRDARAHAKFELELAAMSNSERRKLRREQRQRMRDCNGMTAADRFHFSDKQFQQIDEDEHDDNHENDLNATTGRDAQIAKARLLHHFAENPGYTVALPSSQRDGLREELQRHRDHFAITAQRSAKVAEFGNGEYQPVEAGEGGNVYGGAGKNGLGNTRSGLAHWAVDGWRKADVENFLAIDEVKGEPGALGQAVHRGMQCRAMRFGASMQGWHTMARTMHNSRIDQKRRDDKLKRELKENDSVLALAVAMYGKFDRRRLTTVVENDLIMRKSKSRNTSSSAGDGGKEDAEDNKNSNKNNKNSPAETDEEDGGGGGESTNKKGKKGKVRVHIDQLQLQREVDELEQLCLNFAPEIRGWYIRYSGVNGMGTHDFYLFVKQIRVLSRQFRLVDIDLVRVASGAGDKDEMLNPAEFVEALIRLAIRRYSFAEVASAGASESLAGDIANAEATGFANVVAATETTAKSRKVAERVRRLLVENVSAHAQLVDIDSFRMRFADPGVQRAISSRRRWLIGKFREYCAADASQAATSENAMHTMSLSEWEQFLRDHRVFDARFRNRTAATLFVCAQAPNLMDDEDVSLEDALEDNQELIYQEFLEALVALAHFRAPDPFMALGDRVAALLHQLDEAKPLDRYFASNRFAKAPQGFDKIMAATSTGKVLKNLGRGR
jgi:hypothetical protein